MDDPGWRTNLISPLAALVAAIMGVGFQKCTLALRARLKSVPAGRAWMKPVVGGLVTWAAGAVVFLTTRRTGVYGIGYEDIQSALQGSFVWEVALLLLAAKFLATSACCGSDGNGGIFAPTLYMGTMCGVALAGLAEKFVPLAPASHTALALVGMSAFLGAVMRAPVTGILLVLEMTWDYSLLPGLMVAALVSQAVSRTLLKHGFYDAILEQDGVHLEQVMPPRDLRRWLAWPVASVANFHPVTVGDFKPETLRALLDRHTYAYFPVVREGRLEGVLARAEMAAALHEAREPRPATAPACAASASLREAQAQLLSSTTNLLLVVENERLLGLLTLHDLLRAQTNLADQN
jgi:CIC family chloride channel protein